MESLLGTVVRGIRTPIFKEGDLLLDLLPALVSDFFEKEGVVPRDRDILAITESVVARAQGNYVSLGVITEEIRRHFPKEGLGILFPILSRNRFSAILRAAAAANPKIILQLSFPADEVGNHLVSDEQLEEAGVNPWTDTLTEEEFRGHFGVSRHPFSNMDYISYYRDIIEEQGAECTIVFSNRPDTILSHTPHVLTCDIHTRKSTKRALIKAGAQTVMNLEDLLTEESQLHGYNPQYGLLGSNLAGQNQLKLFPRDAQQLVDGLQERLKEKTGKTLEVMVYGDGAFKDPIGKIWELADPVVSPGYTSGLEGGPSELKLKYLADNQFAHLKGQELREALSQSIREKNLEEASDMQSLGTTPRRFCDLVGSLCDLTSGSGDKGTPLIYIQGYFDSFVD